jgi:hypothetical protein
MRLGTDEFNDQKLMVAGYSMSENRWNRLTHRSPRQLQILLSKAMKRAPVPQME